MVLVADHKPGIAQPSVVWADIYSMSVTPLRNEPVPRSGPASDTPVTAAATKPAPQLPPSSTALTFEPPGLAGLRQVHSGFALGGSVWFGAVSRAETLARERLLDDGRSWQQPETIVDRLGQATKRKDGVPERDFGSGACAPAAVLGGWIMSAADPKAMLKDVTRELAGRRWTSAADGAFRRRALADIDRRLDDGSATFGDLATLVHYLYDIFGEPLGPVVYNRHTSGGVNIDAFESILRLNPATASRSMPDSVRELEDAVAALRSGEIFLLVNNLAGMRVPHLVVVGRDATGPFVFNPSRPVGFGDDNHVARFELVDGEMVFANSEAHVDMVDDQWRVNPYTGEPLDKVASWIPLSRLYRLTE
jgi:hypothetical protein